MGSNLLGHTSQAQPAHQGIRVLCWGGRPGGRNTVQLPGPHTVPQCVFLSLLRRPPGAFRLVRSSQVARCMHHPDTPLPPSPITRALSHPGHLDHPPIPPSTGPVPRPPALVQQTPAPFPPHSASLLPLLLPPPATSNLCSTTPNPTYLTWPLSPSHIHQTRTTSPNQQPLSNHLRLRIPKACQSD